MNEKEIIDHWLNMEQQQPIQPATQDAYWQQVRIQAAIVAMQGMLANPHCSQVQVESGEPFGYFYAMNAIMCADVLVEELQKKGGQDAD